MGDPKSLLDVSPPNLGPFTTSDHFNGDSGWMLIGQDKIVSAGKSIVHAVQPD